MERERQSGILMHISSLPGKYGIGDFGKNAFEFVDFLRETKTRNWQILPLGITGFGDSPYQSFSAFAGNPYFIDLDEFIKEGFLDEDEVKEADLGTDDEKTDYHRLYINKMPLLKKAFLKARSQIKDELKKFYLKEKSWLKDFAMFMAIKDFHGGKSWKEWDEKFKLRNRKAMENFALEHKKEIEFWIFTQYYFFTQWKKLKDYANNSGIKIIGDIPIYVAEDGSDIWSNPKLFKLEDNLSLSCKAGCPPDAFTEDGQLWGNPIYDWKKMKKDGYSWWIKRIKESFRIYDVVRIDHFRGFESYWEIEGDASTAKKGKWVKGPGLDFFKRIKKEMCELDILAEDLGFLTEEVVDLIRGTGFPGMKILVFAFDSRENSDYLPHNYEKNTVVYTGNHDTQTVKGYLLEAPEDEYDYAKEYMNVEDEKMVEGFIRLAWSSTSYLAICPMQDLLELGDEARFNIPSTLGGNWQWRIKKSSIDEKLKMKLRKLNEVYRRA